VLPSLQGSLVGIVAAVVGVLVFAAAARQSPSR
jgi:hypothetical protein